jgi:hypothetical protein
MAATALIGCLARRPHQRLRLARIGGETSGGNGTKTCGMPTKRLASLSLLIMPAVGRQKTPWIWVYA